MTTIAAVGGAGYYIKIVRLKQNAGIDDEGDDIPNDDGAEMQFEDEPEETDEYEYTDDSDNDDENKE